MIRKVERQGVGVWPGEHREDGERDEGEKLTIKTRPERKVEQNTEKTTRNIGRNRDTIGYMDIS